MAVPARPKVLVVLDGMAYAFRAFYAVPEMTSPKGRPTNAVFGFAGALRRAEREFKPDYAAVAFDSPGGSFRDEMLAEYKAHRDAPPEALLEQFPVVEEAARAYGWALLKKPRFEADDIMATLTRLGRAAGCEVRLLTSDKDILQLVGPGVRVHRENPKGASLYGPEQVRERFGVDPGRIADLLGLMGDSSDNIPGVPGVGEKTAAKLLAEHGDLESVLKAAPDIKGRVGENLRAHAEAARLSWRLACLRDDLDLGVGLGDLAFRGPDPGRLVPLLKELGLRSLLAEFERGGRGTGAAPPPSAAPEPVASAGPVASAASASAVASEGPVAVGVLSAPPTRARLAALGFDAAAPCGVALHPAPAAGGEEPRRAVLAQGGAAVAFDPAGWAGLRRTLSGLAAPVLFDSKPLQRCLHDAGLEPLPGVLDLRLGAWLLRSDREVRDLGEAAEFLDPGLAVPGEAGGLLVPADADLAASARVLARLGTRLREALEADGMGSLYADLEAPLVAVLAAMESAGVRVDPEVLGGIEAQAQHEMARLRALALAAAGTDFNLNSPAQLADVLFNRLKLEAGRRTKTGYSTDNEVLESLAESHELPALVLEHRQLAKLSGTYLQALPRLVSPDGRIRCVWNQTSTATGRISSTDPNLQNIPVRGELGRGIRAAFVPGKRGGLILAADYSQVELRILAHASGDPVLKEAFASGRDIHAETAARLNHVDPGAVTPEMRSRAKVINFGVLYGMGPFRVSRECGVPLREARAFLEGYFAGFPKVRDFLEGCKEEARSKGYARTLLGRRRPIPEILSRNRVAREHAERVATNLPIQGTAADLIKRAMLAVDALLRRSGSRSRLIMQVHDELVLEVERGEAKELAPKVRAAMEGALRLDVPLVVEVGMGGNWADAKS